MRWRRLLAAGSSGAARQQEREHIQQDQAGLAPGKAWPLAGLRCAAHLALAARLAGGCRRTVLLASIHKVQLQGKSNQQPQCLCANSAAPVGGSNVSLQACGMKDSHLFFLGCLLKLSGAVVPADLCIAVCGVRKTAQWVSTLAWRQSEGSLLVLLVPPGKQAEDRRVHLRGTGGRSEPKVNA